MDYTIEQKLIEGLVNRDEAAFKYLHAVSYDSVGYLASSLPVGAVEADDIYNQGIVKLLYALDKPDLKMKCKVQTMFINICRSLATDAHRKETAKGNYQEEQHEELYEVQFEDLLDSRMQKDILWKGFKKLKQDCQKLITRVFEEVPKDEIAEELDYTTEYLRKKKRFCMDALFKIIKDDPDYISMQESGEIELNEKDDNRKY